MPDSSPPNATLSLAMVCASLGLVFAAAGAFQAVLGIQLVGRAWLVSLALWALALVFYVVARRAGPPGDDA